jgi:hypothetical protein
MACSNHGDGSDLDGIRVAADSTGAPGTPLGDGFEVADGSVLVGPVFPSSRAGVSQETIDEGWRALLLVTGDLEDVLNAYVTQARAVGLFPQPRCDEGTEGLLACTGVDDEATRGIEMWLQRGRGEDAPNPVSHLFLRYRRTGPQPRRSKAVPAAESYHLGSAWDDVPSEWPALPKSGQRYEHSLTVPEGTELLAHPATPWSAGSSVAVFRVGGDEGKVLAGLVGGRGRAGRSLERESNGIRIASGYTTNPSPAGTVWAETVSGGEQPSYLMVEHDPTD